MNWVIFKAHFAIVPFSIKKLEEIGLPLTESLKIVQNVKQWLESAPGNVAEAAFEKLQGTLAKNPGYEKICITNL
jgi:hypothetical protein